MDYCALMDNNKRIWKTYLPNNLCEQVDLLLESGSTGYKNRDDENPQFSDHCFTGDYPINVEEIQNSKNELFD